MRIQGGSNGSTRSRRQASSPTTCLLLIFMLVALSRSQIFNQQLSSEEFSASVKSCAGFMKPVATTANFRRYPQQILEILTEIDHVFMLSFEPCELALPEQLARRATCIVGSELDKCAPSRYIAGEFTHAMKVSFAHAAMIEISQRARYRHVAIIESDAIFTSAELSVDAVTGFKNILRADDWNLIRFGYRPYFSEESSRKRCARSCRCYMDTRFSQDFCKLDGTGCDIRSSDFYLIHSSVFGQLKAKLLDLRNPNSKRIIDTWPIRTTSKQWLLVPHGTVQRTLDIPFDYQIGLQSLYVKKCVGPRPVPDHIDTQFFRTPS